jgi:hypothetical protein
VLLGRDATPENPFACPCCSEVSAKSANELLEDAITLKELENSGGGSVLPTCGICEEEAATVHCSSCANKLYCDACCADTHKRGAAKSHVLLPIAEHLASGGGGGGGRELPSMCTKHPQYPHEFYCNTCGTVVCASCAVKGHNGHSLIDTSAALATEAAAVETSVAAAATALAFTETGMVAVRKMKVQVQTNAKATDEEVVAHC